MACCKTDFLLSNGTFLVDIPIFWNTRNKCCEPPDIVYTLDNISATNSPNRKGIVSLVECYLRTWLVEGFCQPKRGQRSDPINHKHTWETYQSDNFWTTEMVLLLCSTDQYDTKDQIYSAMPREWIYSWIITVGYWIYFRC